MTLHRIAAAIAFAAIAAPCVAGSVGSAHNVRVTLVTPGLPPPPVVTPPGPASSTGDLCVSQALSSATGAMVRVVCRSGQFVSIEPGPGTAFLGVHGGTFRYYFANAVPEHLRYLGSDAPWVGPGTVTSIRINYPEGLDGLVEMQVGF
jgi:hypothetical protein